MKRRRGKQAVAGAVVLAGAAAWAGFWSPSQPEVEPARGKPFRWDRSGLFAELERVFEAARAARLEDARNEVAAIEGEIAELVDAIRASGSILPSESIAQLEPLQFELAAYAAAKPELTSRARRLIESTRFEVLRAARQWPADDLRTRSVLYRVVYGGRAALEEALVQAGPESLPAVSLLADVPSAAPSVEVSGVTVHSGDVVLSRGGSPTSALIARGNDRPGNFSHAGLVVVDPDSGAARVVESLIERGVVVSTLEQFLGDEKLRLLLLRLRPDHPVLVERPLALHRAAARMARRALDRHIPYDFAMVWETDEKMFCSEVVYHAYADAGVRLWPVPSTISAPGLVEWLAAVGVRELTTLVPSDLEYDPDLMPVAEWRNPATLRDDRLDNAIIDALLEEAERGARLDYGLHMLPIARAVKFWSVLRGVAGAEPTIPEGMTAAAALRVLSLTDRIHPTLRAAVLGQVEAFRRDRGHEPPYWSLVAMAREAIVQNRVQLRGALAYDR